MLHLNDLHGLTFGEFDGAPSARVEAMAAHFAGAKFDARASDDILQDMWEKWVFIASAAGMTCLMRATIGDIVAKRRHRRRRRCGRRVRAIRPTTALRRAAGIAARRVRCWRPRARR